MTDFNLDRSMDRRTFVAAASTAALALGAGALSARASESADTSDTAESTPAGGDYDIVVIGMGGAGMCAAIAAKEAGVDKIVILEKTAIVGGNTNFSSSGMNAAGTKFQQEAGGDAATDTVDLFISDTLTGGKNMNNVDLVTEMCENSSAAIDWLDEHGITLSDITTMGGASVPRCHRPADKSAVGAYIVPLLQQLVEDNGIEYDLETTATELIKDDSGAVTGVVATDANGNELTYNAGAVIITTGGFGANFDLIKMYRPDMADYVTTNASGSTGDGMVLAQKAGANLIQMDQIQAHPTVYQENGALIGEAVRGSGAILINEAGDRFTNEMGTRDAVSAAELAQPDGKVWVFFDQTLYDNTPVVAKYEARGMTIKGDDLASLCDQIGVDATELQATLDTYNAAVADGGESDPFGRTTGLVDPLETAPFYAIPVGPGIHHTMGGIYINTDNQVMTIESEVIPGLFAAGETTGGLHGGNRLGGNAVCDIVVMGKNAGEKAAASLA
jgi:fumarate reductase flavoprotein subunit